MKKIIINENQRGLLFKNGVFTDYLRPGKYLMRSAGTAVQTVSARGAFAPEGFSVDVFMRNSGLASDTVTVDVPDEAVALHFVDGRFSGALCAGRYAFFTIFEKHDFRIVPTTPVEIGGEVPGYILSLMPRSLVTKLEVAEHQKARLYIEKKFTRLLEPGTYHFWNNGTLVEAETVDTRMLTMDITGQEIMTADKVSLRINFVCTYRISDYVRIQTEIDGYEKQIHILLQLALREYTGRYRLDEILENKDQISAYVLGRLREKESGLFVTFAEAGVKDIILPGEIREIMNTVLLAEKKAQANVITRREEVASTRSLLNTAKLMDENQTLYKLKELEYLERICAGVDSISVNGASGLLTQLADLLKGSHTQ